MPIESITGLTGDAGGDHDTIGGDDVAAGIVEVLHRLSGVARIAVERGLSTHLHEVQLGEQNDVEREENQRQFSDAPVHSTTPERATLRRARPAWKRSVTLIWSGASPRRLAVLSLIRNSNASNT